MRSDLKDLERLCALGFSLIWLKPKGKMPFESGWQNAPTRSFTELLQVGKPNYNVGVRLGHPLKDGTFLHAIDVDLKSDKNVHRQELKQALENIGVSLKCVVKSGRGNGSMHIYFRMKERLGSFRVSQSSTRVKVLMPSVEPSKNDRLQIPEDEIKKGYRMRPAWEVDLLSLGRQAVLPHSIHPDTGKAYQWAKGLPETLADIPLIENAHLLAKGRAARGEEEKNKRPEFQWTPTIVDLDQVKISEKMRALIHSMDGLDEMAQGDRSAAINKAIYALVNAGLDDHEIISVLLDVEHAMSERCLEYGRGDEDRAAESLFRQVQKARANPRSALTDFSTDFQAGRPLKGDEIVKQEAELVQWESDLDRTSNGFLKNTLKNTILCLRHSFQDGGKPGLSFNEFTKRRSFLQSPVWSKEDVTGQEVNDMHINEFMHWLSENYFEPGETSCYKAFHILAHEHKTHPVREYLNRLDWDFESRIDRLLIDYIKCEGPREYLERIGSIVMKAAVARIYRPGIKFDTMLILEGYQGQGKSSAIQILAGGEDFFTDALGDVGDSSEYIQNLMGKWFVEVGELDSLNRAEAETFKLFLSRQRDRARLSYARSAEDFPRQCILIGSTNKDEYLKDETGNRRYWPVRVKDLDLEALERDRDQLFAEAVFRWQAGEKIYIDRNDPVLAVAKDQQSHRLFKDIIIDELEKSFKEVIEFSREGYTILELHHMWRPGHKTAEKTLSKQEQMRLASALRVMGWQKQQTMVKGVKTVRWFHPSTQVAVRPYHRGGNLRMPTPSTPFTTPH